VVIAGQESGCHSIIVGCCNQDTIAIGAGILFVKHVQHLVANSGRCSGGENMALSNEPERAETRGLALAALGIAYGTVSRLLTKGVLDDDDLEHVFGGVLSSLEGFLPPNDPGGTAARALVEAMYQIAVSQRTQSTRSA
jgi:hypothetical protein